MKSVNGMGEILYTGFVLHFAILRGGIFSLNWTTTEVLHLQQKKNNRNRFPMVGVIA